MKSINNNYHIETIVNGEIDTNTYIISQISDNTAVVIDPADGKMIDLILEKRALALKMIINTHGHYDHISGNRYLKEKYDIPICIGASDFEYLENPKLNMSQYIDKPYISPKADIILKEGDFIKFGENEIFVKEVPGHTPGSICLKLGFSYFSGDLIFSDGVGRTDLPGGDMKALIKSLKEFWVSVKLDGMIYPGHSESGRKLYFEGSYNEIFLQRY